MSAEASQPIGPEPIDVGEPAFDLVEGRPLEAVVALAPVAAFGHHADVEHQTEVLRDRGAADRQGSGEVADSALTDGESLQQLPPHRVREDPEDVFDGRGSRSHACNDR